MIGECLGVVSFCHNLLFILFLAECYKRIIVWNKIWFTLIDFSHSVCNVISIVFLVGPG